MFVLTTFIHAVFAGIFFMFHRYIEMATIGWFYVIFLSKIIPPLDVIKRPAFLKIKTPENITLEQSIYVSSGILFYTALVGVFLGIAEALGVPADLHLFYYCVFFLTSVIYGIYLLFYPRNPNVFILFRTHTLIAGIVLGLLVMGSTLFWFFWLELLIIINLLLTVLGLSIVIILDRNIPLNTHIMSVYVFIFAFIAFIVWSLSFFSLPLPVYIFFLLFGLTGLYIFFPGGLEKAYLQKNIYSLSWHFSNCILGLSWAAFGYLFWSLFWWYMDDRAVISATLFLLAGLWTWVYNTDDKNPLFFTGLIAVIGTFYGFMTFQILPPIFWMITICLFVFSGGLVLIARAYKNQVEELILAAGSVIFFCASDVVLIFQNYWLFELSTLFFFQSFLWYGVYEIFHRQSHAKNWTL